MSRLKTIRFEGRTLIIVAYAVIGLFVAAFQLHRAWAFGIIWSPRLFGPSWVTLADQPMRFWISVIIHVSVLIVAPFLLWLGVFDLHNAILSFRLRETRPPLDDAIRQPLDER